MNRKPLYHSLAAWRDGERLSQEEAARQLGVSQAYYSRLERQQHYPARVRAKKISEITGVPLESVLGVAHV